MDYPSPPYNDTNRSSVDNNQNILYINNVLQEESIKAYQKVISNIISEFRTDTKKHELIPTLLTLPYYVLMTEGFLNNKTETKIKIKINGKSKNYKFIFFEPDTDLEKKSNQKSDEKFATLIGYNLNGLPSLAKLLAVGNNLEIESVEQRLKWMKITELTYKYNEKNVVQLEYTGMIQCIVDDILHNWELDYVYGWNKLVRLFLLGMVMFGYYENELSSSINKNSKKNVINPSFSKKLKDSLSKCVSSITNNDETLKAINSAAEKICPDNNTPDYNIVYDNVKNTLSKNMKFSFYLFHLVKMFGFVSLISSSVPNPSETLLKLLNPNNLEDAYNSFDKLKLTELGQNLITKNEEYGDKICATVIECADFMKINNDKIETGLKDLVNNYDFNNNENFDELSTSNYEFNETNSLNHGKSINELTKNITTNSEYQVLSNEHKYDGTNENSPTFERSNNTRRKREKVTNPLKRGNPYELPHKRQKNNNNFVNFNLENAKIDEKDKNNMIELISVAEKAFSDETNSALIATAKENINNYSNLSENDANVVSTYEAYRSFVNSNHIKILNENEKKNIISVRDDFLKSLNEQQSKTFIQEYDKNVNIARQESNFNCLNEENFHLLLTQQTINDFHNADNF